jgi:hypothetical protein
MIGRSAAKVFFGCFDQTTRLEKWSNYKSGGLVKTSKKYFCRRIPRSENKIKKKWRSSYLQKWWLALPPPSTL